MCSVKILRHLYQDCTVIFFNIEKMSLKFIKILRNHQELKKLWTASNPEVISEYMKIVAMHEDMKTDDGGYQWEDRQTEFTTPLLRVSRH